MKVRNTILPVLTVLMITVILAVSTGFTVIIHSCNACDELSLKTELYNNETPEYGNCCCITSAHEHDRNSPVVNQDCCKNSVEQFKIVNYPPLDQTKILPGFFLIAELKIFISAPLPEASFIFSENMQKRCGGRGIITEYHQLLI